MQCLIFANSGPGVRIIRYGYYQRIDGSVIHDNTGAGIDFDSAGSPVGGPWGMITNTVISNNGGYAIDFDNTHADKMRIGYIDHSCIHDNTSGVSNHPENYWMGPGQAYTDNNITTDPGFTSEGLTDDIYDFTPTSSSNLIDVGIEVDPTEDLS